jgi:translocation protein SEC72
MDTNSFSQIPITMDSATKTISSPLVATDPTLQEELAALNTLHKALVAAQSDTLNAIPPPPTNVNPKRTANVSKLRESANTNYRNGKHADAIRMYTFGIEMALGRPAWEPSALVREELSGLYANRAQAHMALQNWPEGAADAQCSVELKKVQNAKAWWRRGKCLYEMGRLDEAARWLSEALEFEADGGEQSSELVGLKREVIDALDKRRA